MIGYWRSYMKTFAIGFQCFKRGNRKVLAVAGIIIEIYAHDDTECSSGGKGK